MLPGKCSLHPKEKRGTVHGRGMKFKEDSAVALLVKSVEPETPAARLGVCPGDELLAAGGRELFDMLDYEFHTASAEFDLLICRGGEKMSLHIIKGEYEPLGCDFSTYLADEKHSCDNHCMFCFIDQLPPGLRETLYFKDDDERLSFLYGNYITLTNMSRREMDRIKTMHISPINISVHTTNPKLRIRMLANRRAGEIMEQLRELAAAGIEMNCQLVVCRGVNDGDELRRTLEDLITLAEHIGSIAAVPAGLTDYRKGLYRLEAYDGPSASAALDILEEYGERCLQKLGTRLIYPGDEWYLQAGRSMPEYDFYENFAQLENGVGMWRMYRDEFCRELQQAHGLVLPRKLDVVTGELAAPLIRECVNALHKKYPWVRVQVHAVRNEFFGGNVTVAGLVTGTDIVKQCSGKLQGKTLGIPEVMLRDEKDLFLDNMTPAQVGKSLGVKIEILPNGGSDSCLAMLGRKYYTDSKKV